MEKKMISANMAPQFMIREKDSFCHHYRVQRISISPADPLRPLVREWSVSFLPHHWLQYFGPDVDEARKIRTLQSMAYSSMILIHDPHLRIPGEDQTYFEKFSGQPLQEPDSTKAAREARRQAKIQKLGIAGPDGKV